MNPAVRQLLMGAPFTPARLFRAGEQGAWFDPSDLATMWQDSAGTTPVTAVGQPVGKMLDKSGRGNHATQATAASRPVLQQDASGYYYLAFDGVDDSMATASIDFTGTDKVAVHAGVHKASDALRGMVVELGSGLASGSFQLNAPPADASTVFQFSSLGTALQFAPSTTFPAPVSKVVTGVGDIGGDSVMTRINGATFTTSADQGNANYSNAPLYIGRRGGASLPFNGRIYSLIVRGAATDATTLSRAERYVGGKMGIAL